LNDSANPLISKKPVSKNLGFYQFLGLHSLLIGLLPFYLPVYLWKQGFNLAHLSLLIGCSGLAFCAALTAWQTVARKYSLKHLLGLSFLFEVLLVASVFVAENNVQSLLLIGVLNGVYNGFFWTTQRTQFLQLLGENDSGKRYGNFQIFVTVFLKIGILVGGWLLNLGGLPWLLGLSALVGAASSLWFYLRTENAPLYDAPRVQLAKALAFDDEHRSRPVFFADGLFLFLESHFWTLSLFMLADENFARLGIIVVVLAALFALLFYLIKNTIDKFAVSLIFKLAVILYSLSWFARVFVSNELAQTTLLLLLILITFCSSFFRLAFNKRFFDIAQAGTGVRYLLVKSYQSQLVLGVIFSLGALMLFTSGHTGYESLMPCYIGAGCLTFVYLGYRAG